jgi:hypothetical protein
VDHVDEEIARVVVLVVIRLGQLDVVVLVYVSFVDLAL